MLNHWMKTRILMLPIACLVAACAQDPVIQTGPDAEVIGEGLHKVDNSRMDEAFVDPDVDFSSFDKLFIAQLDVSDVEVIQPPDDTALTARKVEWVLTDDDRGFLQTTYAEKMMRYLIERGGYVLAEKPSDNVMVVRIAVQQIAPTASKDDRESRGIGRSAVFTEGAGSITIKGVIQDGGSGKVVAAFWDRKESAKHWGENDRFHNKADVRNIFDYWAQLFQYRLDVINGKVGG